MDRMFSTGLALRLDFALALRSTEYREYCAVNESLSQEPSRFSNFKIVRKWLAAIFALWVLEHQMPGALG